MTDYDVIKKEGRKNIDCKLSDIRKGDKFKFKRNGTSKFLIAIENSHFDLYSGQYVCIVENIGDSN